MIICETVDEKFNAELLKPSADEEGRNRKWMRSPKPEVDEKSESLRELYGRLPKVLRCGHLLLRVGQSVHELRSEQSSRTATQIS